MENRLRIGIVAKPQGIKGELKIVPLTDDINRFNNLKSVFIDDKNYSVANVKIGVNEVYISFDGICDRNTAETFRNKYLLVDRKDAVSLKENAFFIADLLGLKVVNENDISIGEIVDVTKSKTDYITLRTENNKTACFPFLKDLLIRVDFDNCKMIVKAKRLEEVICYEY